MSQGLQIVDVSTSRAQSPILATGVAPKKPGSRETAPIHYADDLDIASDGGVYFSDATDFPPAYSSKGFYDVMGGSILSVLQVSS